MKTCNETTVQRVWTLNSSSIKIRSLFIYQYPDKSMNELLHGTVIFFFFFYLLLLSNKYKDFVWFKVHICTHSRYLHTHTHTQTNINTFDAWHKNVVHYNTEKLIIITLLSFVDISFQISEETPKCKKMIYI